jgi:AraC-like DNA-binding protein
MSAAKWTNLLCRLLWAYEGPIPERGEGLQETTPHYFAWLLLKGHGQFSFNGKETAELHPGQWGFPPPNAKDRFHHFSKDARLLSLRFRLEWPDGRSPLPLRHFVAFEAESFPELGREAKRLVRLAKGFMSSPLDECEPFGFGLQAKMQANFWRWLSLWTEALAAQGVMAQEPEALEPRLRRMLDILEKGSPHGAVPYQELERASSLGRVQIDRLFREQLKNTPKRLLERRLLELCKERILTSNLGTKELAAELDFIGPSQFCAWFKKHAGMSPQKFREREW